MSARKPPFTTILVALGVLLTAMLVADLVVRGARRLPIEPRWEVEGGDVERGRAAIVKHGCGACHVIPGVRAATGRVGPQLIGLRDQIYLAGVLANDPENLVRWIKEPQHVNPRTAMPNLGVTESEARDMAAYLYANP